MCEEMKKSLNQECVFRKSIILKLVQSVCLQGLHTVFLIAAVRVTNGSCPRGKHILLASKEPSHIRVKFLCYMVEHCCSAVENRLNLGLEGPADNSTSPNYLALLAEVFLFGWFAHVFLAGVLTHEVRVELEDDVLFLIRSPVSAFHMVFVYWPW